MNKIIYPEYYKSEFTKEQWLSMIKNPKIFNTNSIIVMKCLLENESATCKELRLKYGRTLGFYNAVSMNLGKRIHHFTNCPLCNEKDSKYWPILYKGYYVDKDEDRDGDFAYMLVDELREALKEIYL